MWLQSSGTPQGAGQTSAFVAFLEKVQSLTTEDDTYYRYPALEAALRAAGHRLELTPEAQ